MEVVHAHIEAFRAKDAARSNSFFDPHVVWDGSRTGGVGAGNAAYGIDAIADMVRSYRGAFGDYDLEVERLVDLGSGAVLAVVSETGFGRTSGVPVNRPFVVVYTVLERKIVRMTLFPTEQAALEAVGVEAMEPFALAPGEGLSVENPVGGLLTFKLTSDRSGGVLTAIDTVALPGEGPPLHVHPGEDEFIYVLDGSFRVKLGDELVEAAPGAFVFIPRGTPHTWQNVGDTPARFFAGVMPATIAFEQFFLRYSELPAEQRGPEAFARIAAETKAFEVLGPALAESQGDGRV